MDTSQPLSTRDRRRLARTQGKGRDIVPEPAILGMHCRTERMQCERYVARKCDWHGDDIVLDELGEPLKCADCLLEGAPMKTNGELTNE